MLYLHKPIQANTSNLVGAVTTFEIDTSAGASASEVQQMMNSDNSAGWDLGTPIPNIGYPSDSLTPAIWTGDTSSNYQQKSLVLRVTSIGSNTTPTIADLNNTQLVSEAMHSNHSNSFNGTYYADTVTGYTWDGSTMQITTVINGVTEVVGFDQYSLGVNNYADEATALTSGGYTQSTIALNETVTTKDWYYNGILWSSSYGSTSSNEYYTDDTFGSTFQYSTPKEFTSGDYSSKVQGTFGGSTFVNQGRSVDISAITNTDSEKITALLKAIDIQTYRTFKKELS